MNGRDPVPQIEIVKRAEDLAGSLRSPVLVSRSALSKLVATFRQTGDREAFRSLIGAVAAGRGGGRERGTGFSEQIDHASRVLRAFVERESDLSDRELQGVLGWAERLMTIHDELSPEDDPRRGARAARPTGRSAGRRRNTAAPEPPVRREPKPVDRKLGGLGGKNLAVLERLRQDKGDAES